MTTTDFPQPPRGKTQYVFEWLRDRIMSGAMRPGEPIRQDAIAKQLGVSATPVREAFRRLESVGLISHTDNLGAAVTDLSDDEIEEVYLLRGAMEGLAAGLAAQRRSDGDLARLRQIHDEAELLSAQDYDAGRLAKLSREFHDEVSRIGSPAVIAPRVQQLWWTFPVPRSTSLWSDRALARTFLDAHQEILAALERGDGGVAERLTRDHVHSTGQIRRDRAVDDAS